MPKDIVSFWVFISPNQALSFVSIIAQINASVLAGSDSVVAGRRRNRNNHFAACLKPPEMNNKNKYVSCRIIDSGCARRRIIDSKYVSCGIIDNEIRIIYFSIQLLSLSLSQGAVWQRRKRDGRSCKMDTQHV